MDKGIPAQDGFDKLLRWLDPERDKAGEKYARIQSRLIRIFSSRGCYDAEDLADKTINVITLKIDWLLENYVGDPALYFYAVAKKIFLESLKKKPPPDVPPIDPEPPHLEEVCAQLDECLMELPSVDRDLVLAYQEGDKQKKIKNRKKLAEELKISRNALRIRVCHIHARLRECIERLQRQPITE
jgi:DNA-directed RNA polymerase specialized sigma24 family protein